jgi:hypothetical protein
MFVKEKQANSMETEENALAVGQKLVLLLIVTRELK